MIERSILLNGDFYQRTDGAETSAIVSEIYMQSLGTTAITTADHPPKVWECHVDVVFSIVQKTYLQELSTVYIPKHSSQEKKKTTPLFQCSIYIVQYDDTIEIMAKKQCNFYFLL